MGVFERGVRGRNEDGGRENQRNSRSCLLKRKGIHWGSGWGLLKPGAGERKAIRFEGVKRAKKGSQEGYEQRISRKIRFLEGGRRKT